MRKYSGEQELIWGDNNCEHQWDSYDATLLHENRQGLGSFDVTPKIGIHGKKVGQASFCSLCGAWKGAYGLEPTPEMYIEHTIEILREIRRVLRKDGVVFWNIGDSYTPQSSHAGGTHYDKFKQTLDWDIRSEALKAKKSWGKPKDLCLIPFRIALAAQGFAAVSAKEILQCADYLKEARITSDWGLVEIVEGLLRVWSKWAFLDGWWDRSVIIWSKPNPMPESVTDRPTESHEYILMLTKSGTIQYWTHPRKRGSRTKPKPDYIWTHKRIGLIVDYQPVSDRILKEFWTRRNLWRGHDYYWDADAVREQYTEPMNRWGGETLKRDTSKTAAYKEMQNIGYSSAFRVGRPMRPNPSGRNIRSVWEFPTQPYPEAHFAVFPEKLPEICIKAATSEVGCCSKCGAPWERVLDKRPSAFNIRVRDAKAGRATPEEGYKATQEEIDNYLGNHPDPGYRQTIGWHPTCKCNASRVPSLVLDPLMGAGTTLWVAKKLNRYAVGCDTSVEYCQLAVDRCQQQVLL